MQEKSALNFPFNTQVQEKSVESGCRISGKSLVAFGLWVDSGKNRIGDILQSDISQVQLNTLLNLAMNRSIILILIMLLAGCDTFPRATYSLGSEAVYKAQGEVSTLCERLSSVADAHNLEQRSPRRSGTQCYFSDSDTHSLVLGARTLNEQLVVDVEAFNRMEEFRSLNQDVEEMLQGNYPGKYLRVSE